MSASNLHLHGDREHLLAAVLAADAVVPSTSSKPILTNLLLDAKPTHLEVNATDGQVGLRSLVRRVEIRGQGQAVVNSRQLAMILRESSSPTATLELEQTGDASVLAIRLSDGDYSVPAVIGETFPPVSFFPADVVPFAVPADRLEDMLRRTTFAMDKERTSPTLSGLSLTIGQGELIIAATDGKVLSEAFEKSPSFTIAGADKLAVVLPAVAVNHLSRILGSVSGKSDGRNDKHDKVEIAFAGKLAFLRLAIADGLLLEFTTRLVDGTFPAYRAALANATGQVAITFHSAQLASAVRRVALMTQQASRAIVMSLDKDVAVFSNMNYTNGSARIPVSCQYSGAPAKFGLNSQYLADILKVYGGEHIGIEVSRGLIMREPGMTYLIMPISLPV
jgi:DNA polymerase III subunit beta